MEQAQHGAIQLGYTAGIVKMTHAARCLCLGPMQGVGLKAAWVGAEVLGNLTAALRGKAPQEQQASSSGAAAQVIARGHRLKDLPRCPVAQRCPVPTLVKLLWGFGMHAACTMADCIHARGDYTIRQAPCGSHAWCEQPFAACPPPLPCPHPQSALTPLHAQPQLDRDAIIAAIRDDYDQNYFGGSAGLAGAPTVQLHPLCSCTHRAAAAAPTVLVALCIALNTCCRSVRALLLDGLLSSSLRPSPLTMHARCSHGQRQHGGLQRRLLVLRPLCLLPRHAALQAKRVQPGSPDVRRGGSGRAPGALLVGGVGGTALGVASRCVPWPPRQHAACAPPLQTSLCPLLDPSPSLHRPTSPPLSACHALFGTPGSEDVQIDIFDWQEEGDQLTASWRFSAILDLPWRPRLAAAGSTTHVIDPQQGLVVQHIERWKADPGKVCVAALAF